MDHRSREILAELLLDWEDRCRMGQDTPAGEIAHEHPELVGPLEERIAILKKTLWLDSPSEPSTDSSQEEAVPRGRVMLAGRYRLEHLIATGGFAVVWRGYDPELQRAVAIKIPKATRVDSADVFLAEARRVARLHHPHIVPVHDVGIDGHGCFIVSEFMEGGSLADRLAAGRVERGQAVRWIAQIADALDFAHRQGVVHRDVKPANILVNRHGDAVLGDFGIAHSATKTGDFAPSIGTLRYMSPEQLAGGMTTPAADIFSLGVVLHEALSGDVPYSSDEPNVLRREITSEAGVRISRDIPSVLAGVCRRALARNPSGRHATAARLADDLRRALRPRRPGGWLPGVAVGLVAIPATLLLGTSAWRGREAKPANPITMPPPHVIVASPRDRMPVIPAAGSPPKASLRFSRMDEALPHVVAASNVGLYREWQNPPLVYVGPLENGVEGWIVYRFEFSAAVRAARLLGGSFCVDFTREQGGSGRGASAIDVSCDGVEWTTLRDDVKPRRWGDDWLVDEELPRAVLGGRSIWVRVRFIAVDCPNTAYTVAQFGRDPVVGASAVFGIDAELAPGDR
jgi:hypothetical protein